MIAIELAEIFLQQYLDMKNHFGKIYMYNKLYYEIYNNKTDQRSINHIRLDHVQEDLVRLDKLRYTESKGKNNWLPVFIQYY